jgi:UDP-2,3-diacylglucosamine hydrolase
MKKSLIVSDIHLSPNPEHIINVQFLTFLKNEAYQYDAIYVLGDLFDRWLGDDIGIYEFQTCLQQFSQLANEGKQLYFMPGNRDFLVGKQFFQTTGFIPLDDIHQVNLYGHEYLMTHGDLLCCHDHQYLKMRRWFHKPWLQTLFLALPVKFRKHLGSKIQTTTQSATQHKSIRAMDVCEESVIEWCLQFNCQNLIHGHTHRADIHLYHHSEQSFRRYVLGDWGHNTLFFEASEMGLKGIHLPFDPNQS